MVQGCVGDDGVVLRAADAAGVIIFILSSVIIFSARV